jgi:hypothetical protein
MYYKSRRTKWRLNESIYVAGFRDDLFFFDGPTHNLNWLLSRTPPIEERTDPAYIWEYKDFFTTNPKLIKRYRYNNLSKEWVERWEGPENKSR